MSKNLNLIFLIILSLGLIVLTCVETLFINKKFFHVDKNDGWLEDCVYVTTYGHRYHNKDCSYLINKNIKAIGVNEAINKGFSPCSKCKGITDEKIVVGAKSEQNQYLLSFLISITLNGLIELFFIKIYTK